MYIAHPTHGAGTRPHRTQLQTTARKTTLNAGQCMRQPRKGRGRNRQAPPPAPQKKRRGEGEKARKQPPAAKPPANTTTGGQPPPRRHRRQDPHRGTGGPPTKNRQHQASNSGPRGKGTLKRKKKKENHQPSLKERGWRDRDHTARKKKRKRKRKTKERTKAQKTHPDNPAKKGLGTAETRAQHTRPHRTPEPETAGGKRGAHETTNIPKAGRNRSQTTNTTNSRH